MIAVIQLFKGLLQRAKLPTLYNRRLQDIAIILMYEVKNCRLHFLIPRVNSTRYGKHSVRYIYLGPILWSNIDRKFRKLKTVDQFK